MRRLIMNRFVIPSVAALAVIAGSAMADQREQTGHGQTAPQPGAAQQDVPQRAPEAGLHDLIAMEVVGQQNRKVGDIINVLVDQEGQVQAVIIQRGTALLGIGGEEVAIPFDWLRFSEPGMAEVERRVWIDMTEEQIGELPTYEGYREIRDHPRAPGMQPGLPPEEQPGRRQPDQ
jgi:sporulation protein YlmC with PRC-barrel domain